MKKSQSQKETFNLYSLRYKGDVATQEFIETFMFVLKLKKAPSNKKLYSKGITVSLLNTETKTKEYFYIPSLNTREKVVSWIKESNCVFDPCGTNCSKDPFWSKYLFDNHSQYIYDVLCYAENLCNRNSQL